jgi:hypothetical protein
MRLQGPSRTLRRLKIGGYFDNFLEPEKNIKYRWN